MWPWPTQVVIPLTTDWWHECGFTKYVALLCLLAHSERYEAVSFTETAQNQVQKQVINRLDFFTQFSNFKTHCSFQFFAVAFGMYFPIPRFVLHNTIKLQKYCMEVLEEKSIPAKVHNLPTRNPEL